MYRVLLVDDEHWALRGIRQSFNWGKEGFMVFKETTRSAEALDIILNEMPDVVFTDIRMPKISGIELMKRVREKGLDTEFIVVSGFNDFTYAQQAMQQGAFDYCLKPLEIDNSDKLLKKLYMHLQEKNKNREMELIESIRQNRTDIEDILIKHGFKTLYPNFQALMLVNKEKSIFEINLEFPPKTNALKISLGINKLLYLFNCENNIKDFINQLDLSDISIGISSISDCMDELSRLYIEANMAASSYFINSEYKLYMYAQRDIVHVNKIIKGLFTSIDVNDTERMEEVLEGIPQVFAEQNLLMGDVVYLWNHVVAYRYKNYPVLEQIGNLDFMDYEQILDTFSDFKSLCGTIYDEMRYLLDKEYEKGPTIDTTNEAFNNILHYIHRNYNQQLFLRDLAEKYFINQNYCCHLFRKYKDTTFSDYVNKLRMEKATNLLKSKELTLAEVAQRVGYNDYFYFNKVFKKIYGMTPTNYRKEIGAGVIK